MYKGLSAIIYLASNFIFVGTHTSNIEYSLVLSLYLTFSIIEPSWENSMRLFVFNFFKILISFLSSTDFQAVLVMITFIVFFQ
jgi:hypothetical protein